MQRPCCAGVKQSLQGCKARALARGGVFCYAGGGKGAEVMNLDERIQSLRKRSGLSQEQLAEAIGVSRQAVSRWETAPPCRTP